MRILVVLFLFCSAISSMRMSWGAACCARSSAAPSLIVGDDEAQIGIGISLSGRVAEVNGEGIANFGSSNSSDWNQNIRLDGAFLVTDRIQLGLGIAVSQHFIKEGSVADSAVGMGDFKLTSAYEFLPNWTYSLWRPQGYLFAVASLPTGKSVYESNNALKADVNGNGFYSFALGTLFLKRWSSLDTFLMPELHYALPRTFQNIGRPYQVSMGWGGSLGVGVGFSYNDFRFGLRMQPRLDQARVSELDPIRDRNWVSSCDFGIDTSYLASSNDSIMLSYTDQTILGPALNTNLNRVFSIGLQHRWER